ncbi:MFS transporter, DHA1 family, inner membrane transport protein [Pseudomonas reinekei]|jgi:DHA1 family inner membrane transport protein|uniref:MFS transporter, DHA1 family, inner membrane transport protein n=1 Tax=Pseudomonas reinekei TaxID=395598 RepID=A0A1H0QBQ6_PSERE|nr:MFS transporter, DHA1 family, inner membrane transport protein [Pseudomonas reinekei]
MPLALLALAVAAFGIGTTEFVIMGLFPDVARDLAVSIPHAGQLITGYALGVVFGAPILAVGTANMPRKARPTCCWPCFSFIRSGAMPLRQKWPVK